MPSDAKETGLTIDHELAAMLPELTAWRQDLHQHPELGFEETRTAGLVAERLASFGVEVHQGLAKTGVVGVLRGEGGTSDRAIGLRADMDALPMPDLKSVPYRSTIPGKMHGCGHDGHTVMLLGAAGYLARHREFAGTVCFIFQPAEEGRGGGKAMVADGLFKRFPVDTVWGLHNWPGLPLGRFAVHAGPVMAGVDYFDITVHGRGSHAGMPHEGIDPVLVGAHIVTGLQSVVSRSAPPSQATAIGVPIFEGADAYHVIPDRVRLAGSFRYFDAAVRKRMEARIKGIAAGIAEGFGAEAEIDYRQNYPPTVNSAAEAAFAATVAGELVGEDQLAQAEPPSMAAEDFAFMLNEKPGCYVWMGQDDGDHKAKLHHPSYDFNDAAIPLGVRYWLKLVERALPAS
jgi:amidohydrolase